jgi:hypothetical protein
MKLLQVLLVKMMEEFACVDTCMSVYFMFKNVQKTLFRFANCVC